MGGYRVGIVGCGWAGERHAAAYRAARGRVSVVAVADSDESVARSRASEWGVQHWETEYWAILETDDLDAVSICLPHSLHCEAALAAVDAGCHVLVEKPLASDLREADSMIDAAARSGMKIMVAESVRFSPLYVKAAELVRSGRVGEVFLIRIERIHQMHAYLRQRPWFLSDPAGGIMMSGGVHDFEAVRMLGGEIEHVYSTQARKSLREMSSDDTSVALAGLRGGAVAVVVESFSTRTPDPGTTFVVHGDAGSIWGGSSGLVLYTSDEDGRSNLVEEVKLPEGDPFELEIAHFLDCLDTGAEPLTAAADQRAPLVAVLAAYRSMETGQRVWLAEME